MGDAWGLADAGDGAATYLYNAISGSTIGVLSLMQRASGGSSGDVWNGANGTAGAATSIMELTSDLASAADISTYAKAGDGGSRNSDTGRAADGATALARTQLGGMSPGQMARAQAIGGNGAYGRQGFGWRRRIGWR